MSPVYGSSFGSLSFNVLPDGRMIITQEDYDAIRKHGKLPDEIDQLLESMRGIVASRQGENPQAVLTRVA
jgi:hypothetical protein